MKRFANVFATRFESHVTADDIETYLRQRLGGGNKLSVEPLATKYDNYASFPITLAGNLSGGEANLAYELLNIQQSIDGLMSILSLFIIHVALVHVRVE